MVRPLPDVKPEHDPEPEQAVKMQSFMMTLARGMAVLGGIVLTLLVLLTCVSVGGRLLNTVLHGDMAQAVMPGLADWLIGAGVGPVLGDFELVEAGVAFAIFAFLPLCQITGGHATVDIFTARLPAAVNRWLQGVVDVVFAAVLILIAWRLMVGMQDKMAYSETTFMLQFPVWWAYAASLAAACVAALIGVYVAAARIVEGVSGRIILPGREGMDG